MVWDGVTCKHTRCECVVRSEKRVGVAGVARDDATEDKINC